MMAERGDWLFRSRGAMWICGWPHSRITHRSEIEREQGVVAKFPIVNRCQLHDEVVGMLAVHDGLPKRGLSLLEQLRVETLAHCPRFQAGHKPQGQLARAKLLLCHRHEP